MNNVEIGTGNLKRRIFHEIGEYWINVIYLSFVFAAVTEYQRLLLGAHGITYTHYGTAVIQALILAKVIMIGDALRLGRELEQKPLIYSTIYKTVVFTLFVGAFKIIEHVLKGLWKGEGLAGGLVDFFGQESHELLARTLIVFVTFIPFFAVKELARVLGQDKIRELFFRRSADQ